MVSELMARRKQNTNQFGPLNDVPRADEQGSSSNPVIGGNGNNDNTNILLVIAMFNGENYFP